MIATHGVKYLGSKKKLLPFIWDVIEPLEIASAIDVFTGTTRVAQHLRQRRIQVTSSDLSWASRVYAGAFIESQSNLPLWGLVEKMNRLDPVEGWLTRNYTGEGEGARADGRLFQRASAMKADAARDFVETLTLTSTERAVLITSIIFGLDAVDNTVGVQQAYLKSWCKRSYNPIIFGLPQSLIGPTGRHIEGDALRIDYPEADLAYIDPPYSPHSYATYYHVWDSIAKWDKPETALKARRRLDRVVGSSCYDGDMVSPWNSKATAASAFHQLLGRLPVKHLLISYSDESLVERGELLAICERHGGVTVSEVDYRRNIMSQIGNAAAGVQHGQTNKEMLILVSR